MRGGLRLVNTIRLCQRGAVNRRNIVFRHTHTHTNTYTHTQAHALVHVRWVTSKMKSMKLKRHWTRCLVKRIRTFCAWLVLKSSINEHLIFQSDTQSHKKQNKLCRYQEERSLRFYSVAKLRGGSRCLELSSLPRSFSPSENEFKSILINIHKADDQVVASQDKLCCFVFIQSLKELRNHSRTSKYLHMVINIV